MSDVTTQEEVTAIQALTGVFSQSITQLANASSDQQISIMGVAAVVACLPGTKNIPPERIGAIINLLAQGRPDADVFKQKMAQFIALMLTTSARVTDAPVSPVKTAH
jgi:hypothetical protein